MKKKSQHANLAFMEIRNIRTFGYDVHGIYTLGPPSNEGVEPHRIESVTEC